MKPFRMWTSVIPAAVLAVGALLIVSEAQAQQPVYDPLSESMFQRGVAEFDRGLYRPAIAVFDSVIAIQPATQRVTAASIMKAKSLFELSEYYDASKVARSFLAVNPTSRYVADANLILARIYLRIERFDEARLAALQAWRSLPQNPSASLVRQVLAAVDTVYLEHTPLDGVYNAVKWSVSASERGHLWFLVTQREVDKGNIPAATVAIDSLTSRYGAWVPRDAIDRLRLRLSGVSTMKIGILLPLFQGGAESPVKEIGNATYDGILTAFQAFLDKTGKSYQISLEASDTEHDLQIATDKARALVKDSTVLAIIGPVYSTEAIAAARVAGANDVPLITPTANQNGISALGPTIFQANPDYEQRGRAMARYAVGTLGAKIVAVLAPSDTYAKFLADGFIKEAKEEGANVAVVQWYQKGMSDLRAQFSAIRAAGLLQSAEPIVQFGGKISRQDVMNLVRLGLPVRRVDSLLARGAKVSARWLLGPRGKELLDSVGIRLWYDQSAVDSTDLPVTGIEALYCPISGPDEIGIVSSQLVYNNIKTHFLGSGEWNSLSDLEANRRYCKGIQFESDTYIDSSSDAFRKFITEFNLRFKKNPDRFTIYGYDAMNLVLSQIANGATNRRALTRALSSVSAFSGVRGKIGFTEGRVNGWIHILEYDGDGLRHITEVNGSPLTTMSTK